MYNIKKYATNLFFAGIFVFCFGLFPAVSLAAVTVHMDCTYAGLIQGSPLPSCVGSTMTFSSGTGFIWDNSHGVLLPGIQTWYVSATVTGSGTGQVLIDANGSAGGTPVSFTTTMSDVAVVAPATGASTIQSLEFKSNSSFAGTISNICVTDTPGGCVSTSNGTSPFSAFSSTTVYTVVDNPNQDFFNGILIFLTGMFGVMWFFSKKR